MIGHLDHLVIVTENEKRCIQFYTQVLGMQLETFIEANFMPPVLRKALKFGNQKLNIKVRVRIRHVPLYENVIGRKKVSPQVKIMLWGGVENIPNNPKK